MKWQDLAKLLTTITAGSFYNLLMLLLCQQAYFFCYNFYKLYQNAFFDSFKKWSGYPLYRRVTCIHGNNSIIQNKNIQDWYPFDTPPPLFLCLNFKSSKFKGFYTNASLIAYNLKTHDFSWNEGLGYLINVLHMAANV